VLRIATDSDVDQIRIWRNHPTVRAVSVTDHEITEAEHRAWWTRVRDRASDRVLIFVDGGIDAGVVTFTAIDPVEAGAAWGFYLDVDGHDERGTALSAWLEVCREALDYAFGELDLRVLHGEVLEHNIVVRRMNRRFGFVEGEPVARDVDGRTVRIIPIHLNRADRRATPAPAAG
jgi:UDP-4-amino-4,6-dideoxy-N-acetyl-beta-L-altrosamine N-acetyltransferase